MAQERRKIGEKINSLGSTEHLEIYKMLKEHDVPYSENKNGIFFNLTTLDSGILGKLEEFVRYCHDNKTELDEYDKRLNECKYRNSISNIVRVPAFQSSINEPINKNERWKELVESIDKADSVQDFIDKISNHVEKQVTKRSGTKFVMAKKKFAKKTNTDTEYKNELEADVS